MDRRRFTKSIILGTAATTSLNFFFPKPVEAHTYDFRLGNADVESLFYDLIRIVQALIDELEQAHIAESVRSINKRLSDYGYTQNPTPYAKRTASAYNAPIWGREAMTSIAPNPIIATMQLVRDRYSEANFSGPTLVGIDKAANALANEGFSPEVIDASLMPKEGVFEDWTDWFGDPHSLSLNPGIGLAQYETRLGEITSRYEAIDPYGTNVGRVRTTIEAANQPRRIITTNILA